MDEQIHKNTVTVILNVYKRPQHLEEQFNSIINQTIKPSKIIIWNNGCTDYDFTKYKKHKLVTFYDSNNNFGVWARFLIGQTASTEFICVFDDDTIPGRKWLENCVTTSQKVDGALGTIGILYKPGNEYNHITRLGWVNPNEEIAEVDTICHSWFFRREHFDAYANDLPDFLKYKIFGEDMHLTYCLQKYKKVKTFVPPHPKNDQEMWGCYDPKKGWEYGTESVAISVTMAFSAFNIPYKRICEMGFESKSNRERDLATKDKALTYFKSKIDKGMPFTLINLNVSQLPKNYGDKISDMNHIDNYFIKGKLQIKSESNIINFDLGIQRSNLINNYPIILISVNIPKTDIKGNIIESINFENNLSKLDDYISIVKNIAKKYANKLVLCCSCDDETSKQISKVLLVEMYDENQNNMYIDCQF